MSLIAQITPLEIALALLAVGAIETLLCRFSPETMVGPDGWLLRRDLT
jgi:hypothetical protein